MLLRAAVLHAVLGVSIITQLYDGERSLNSIVSTTLHNLRQRSRDRRRNAV